MTCFWLAHDFLMTDWLTDWLVDWLTYWLTYELTDWLINCDWLDSLQLFLKSLTVWIGHGLCRIGPCLILSPSWTQNEMLNFLFLVSKLLKNIFKKYIFYTYINLWTTMKFVFKDQLFMKKPRKHLQGVLFSRCRSRTPILAKINIV